MMKRQLCLFGLAVAILALGLSALAEVPSVKIGKYPQEIATVHTVDQGLPSNDVLSIRIHTDGNVYAETDKGWALMKDGAWTKTDAPQGLTDDETAEGPGDEVVTWSPGHLLVRNGGEWNPLVVDDGLGRQWGTSDVRGVAFDSEGQLWFACLAGAACRTADGWTFYTGQDGLPYNDFTVVEAGPNGVVWFGTHKGIVRFDNGEWAYRQGRRWLPNDDVRDVAVDAKGNAWIATAGGVGYVGWKMMTLAEKAELYEDEMERYIRRTPFGYVCEVGLTVPGDKTSEIIYNDSDNDGLWTSMYGAGECFAYAATKDPKAKDRAKRAFEALRFLQKVTQGCEHSPPKGYVARTIRSVDLPDPNEGRYERDKKEQEEGDYLWKAYEPRWPKSADGKWYWKSDTSSDELDGHYFFYPLYYDLVAETEEEKERVREVVRDLTDHLIKHDYYLVDHDGTPTRWSVYGPDSLNHDFNWWEERGLKSISMLSYLAVAEHMTGDKKYRKHLNRLRDKHAYDTNAMIYKIHRGIGSGNQSDDEMAFMSYYNLVKYANDEELYREMLYSFFSAWVIEQPEMNPFFNFCYAVFGIGGTYTNPWGTYPIDPWEGWLEDSMATLTGFPLDRVDWRCENSHRLDILPLPRQQAVAPMEPPRPGKGYRVNGKVIPVENRHFNHWNSNPWDLDTGGSGKGLANGTVFLLPYYMGLYHGFIEETE